MYISLLSVAWIPGMCVYCLEGPDGVAIGYIVQYEYEQYANKLAITKRNTQTMGHTCHSEAYSHSVMCHIYRSCFIACNDSLDSCSGADMDVDNTVQRKRFVFTCLVLQLASLKGWPWSFFFSFLLPSVLSLYCMGNEAIPIDVRPGEANQCCSKHPGKLQTDMLNKPCDHAAILIRHATCIGCANTEELDC